MRFAFVYAGLFGAFAVISPYLQLFLRALGYSPAQIGLLLGGFEVAGIFGPMILGRWGDRTGQYKLLLWITMGLALLLHLLLMADMPFPLSLAVIFLLGFTYKNNIPLTDTLTSRGLPDFSNTYGKVRIVGSMTYVTVSLVLSVFRLIDGSSARSIIIWFSLLMVFQLVTIAFIPRTEEGKDRIAGKSPPLGLSFWLAMGIVFFNRLSMTAYYSFFFLFAQEVWGVEKIGALSALASFSEVPVFMAIGYLIRRFGYRRLFTLSLLGVSLRMMINALSPVLTPIILGQLLHCLTFGLMHGAIISFIQENTEEANRGLAMAVYMSVGVGISGFLGSAMGGYLVEIWGYGPMFFLYGLFPLLGLVPVFFLGRKDGVGSIGKSP